MDLGSEWKCRSVSRGATTNLMVVNGTTEVGEASNTSKSAMDPIGKNLKNVLRVVVDWNKSTR